MEQHISTSEALANCLTMPLEGKRMQVAPMKAFPYMFVDGEIVREEDGCISTRANALSYGTGTFEGIRAFWGDRGLNMLAAREHFARMQRSAKILGLQLHFSIDDLIDASIRLLQKNDVREDAYLRPLLVLTEQTLHVRVDGLASRFSISVTAMGMDYINSSGVRCIVSTWRRAPDVTIPSRAKVTGGYMGPALAKSEALRLGADEAIMLNMDGHVAEASTSNVFLRFGNRWVTPPADDDILAGITRAQIVTLTREILGEDVSERSVDRSELYTADEILLCGTAAVVVPVISIDGRAVGDGLAGERTLRLQRTLLAIARRDDPRHEEWLTPVPAVALGVGF